MMRVALPQRTAPEAAPKSQPAALQAAPVAFSPAPARGDESTRLAAALSRLEPLPYASPTARAVQRKARAGANAALGLPAQSVVQAVWEGEEDGMQRWDELIDGVQWSKYANTLWYEIVDEDRIELGTVEGYKKWESKPYTEAQWDDIERTGEAPPEAYDSDGESPGQLEQEARQYDIVSIRGGGAHIDQPANDIDAGEAFAGLGGEQPLESIAMVRPTPPGTNHYEVQAIVGGVRVKIDLTSSGFRLIYNAGEPGPGYSLGEPQAIVGKSGNDLYQAFLGIALSRNYHMENTTARRSPSSSWKKSSKRSVKTNRRRRSSSSRPSGKTRKTSTSCEASNRGA